MDKENPYGKVMDLYGIWAEICKLVHRTFVHTNCPYGFSGGNPYGQTIIPYGFSATIHMDFLKSIWIPYGFSQIHMDSIWNTEKSIWITEISIWTF